MGRKEKVGDWRAETQRDVESERGRARGRGRKDKKTARIKSPSGGYSSAESDRSLLERVVLGERRPLFKREWSPLSTKNKRKGRGSSSSSDESSVRSIKDTKAEARAKKEDGYYDKDGRFWHYPWSPIFQDLFQQEMEDQRKPGGKKGGKGGKKEDKILIKYISDDEHLVDPYGYYDKDGRYWHYPWAPTFEVHVPEKAKLKEQSIPQNPPEDVNDSDSVSADYSSTVSSDLSTAASSLLSSIRDRRRRERKGKRKRTHRHDDDDHDHHDHHHHRRTPTRSRSRPTTTNESNRCCCGDVLKTIISIFPSMMHQMNQGAPAAAHHHYLAPQQQQQQQLSLQNTVPRQRAHPTDADAMIPCDPAWDGRCMDSMDHEPNEEPMRDIRCKIKNRGKRKDKIDDVSEEPRLKQELLTSIIRPEKITNWCPNPEKEWPIYLEKDRERHSGCYHFGRRGNISYNKLTTKASFMAGTNWRLHSRHH